MQRSALGAVVSGDRPHTEQSLDPALRVHAPTVGSGLPDKQMLLETPDHATARPVFNGELLRNHSSGLTVTVTAAWAGYVTSVSVRPLVGSSHTKFNASFTINKCYKLDSQINGS